jgi:hypothetical protein
MMSSMTKVVTGPVAQLFKRNVAEHGGLLSTRQPVREGVDDEAVVACNQQQAVMLTDVVLQQVEDNLTVGSVQVGRRLIGQISGGSLTRARARATRCCSPGSGVGIVVQQVVDVQGLRELLHALPCLGLRYAAPPGAGEDIFRRRQERQQVELLI